jgi:hypothetical protein
MRVTWLPLRSILADPICCHRALLHFVLIPYVFVATWPCWMCLLFHNSMQPWSLQFCWTDSGIWTRCTLSIKRWEFCVKYQVPQSHNYLSPSHFHYMDVISPYYFYWETTIWQISSLTGWLYATDCLRNNWPRRQDGWPYGDLTSKARQTLGVID